MTIVRGATLSESVEAKARIERAEADAEPLRFAADIADRVPHQVREKLLGFRDLKADRHAVHRRVSDSVSEMRLHLQTWEGRLQNLRANMPPEHREDDSHPSFIEANTEIKNSTAALSRLTERSAELSTSWQSAARLVTSIERYLLDAEQGGIRLHDGDPSPLKAGERAIDALERAARRTRTLLADRKEVLAAPFPVAVAKKLAREQIAKRVEAAKPDVTYLVERCDPIEFPHNRMRVSEYGGSAASVLINDHIGLLAWLFPKQFQDAIDKEIDAAGDDKAALSLEQRIAKLAEIDGDMLASERDEAHFSELAGLLPRSDIDPRAVLNLASDMPSPKRD
ncbi:hypothetical protein [Bradyrhizobium sp. USDA 3256]